MIVDTSALIAVLQSEPESDDVLAALERSDDIAISAATLLEASIVADGARDPVRSARFDELIESFAPEVVQLDAAQVATARRAYHDFGRGSGHAARLNFGDCFAYALAKTRREPLLYVGDDFARTDVASALHE